MLKYPVSEFGDTKHGELDQLRMVMIKKDGEGTLIVFLHDIF